MHSFDDTFTACDYYEAMVGVAAEECVLSSQSTTI